VLVEDGQLSLMVIFAVVEFNKFVEYGGCVVGVGGSDGCLGCVGGLVCLWILWCDCLGCGWGC
jgi:hypothetical protein